MSLGAGLSVGVNSGVGDGFGILPSSYKFDQFSILWKSWKTKVSKLRLWTQSVRKTTTRLDQDMDYVERKMFEQLEILIERSSVQFQMNISRYAEVHPREVRNGGETLE